MRHIKTFKDFKDKIVLNTILRDKVLFGCALILQGN